MSFGLIWAQSTSGIIGRDGGIPWQVPEDMAHFKTLTTGCTVVMGRRTWESLPPRFRPLPGRRNIVLTRQSDYQAEGADVVGALDDAVVGDGAWVIGGAEIYRLALPMATRCEVTEIEIDLERRDSDAIAPALDESWRSSGGDWNTSSSGLRYRFHRYDRV